MASGLKRLLAAVAVALFCMPGQACERPHDAGNTRTEANRTSGTGFALTERALPDSYALALDMTLVGESSAWPPALRNLERDAITASTHIGGAGLRVVVHLIPIDRAAVSRDLARCATGPDADEASFLSRIRPFVGSEAPCATALPPLLLIRGLAARSAPSDRPHRNCADPFSIDCTRLFFLDNSAAAVRAGVLESQPATEELFLIGYGLDGETGARVVCGIDSERYAGEVQHSRSAHECLQMFNRANVPEE